MRVNLDKIVTLDFETYYDNEYSLKSKELNTSEYIRHPRFKAHCVGIKIGNEPTQVYWEDQVKTALHSIDWTTHAVLCHHTQFDGLILSHHYGIIPAFYFDTMSMARAMHSNQIRSGHGLDSVAAFYGVGNKLPNVLGKMKAHLVIPEELRPEADEYTKTDVDLTLAVFRAMAGVFPDDEFRLIDQTMRMFCDPVFFVDLPRVETELERELAEKQAKVEACGFDIDELMSAGKLAAALRSLGVEPPMKVSQRTNLETYAFSLQDEDFIALGAHEDPRVRALIAARLAVKSTLGETRARRFIKAGSDGHKLPVYLNYCGAHTTRWSGGNKLNLQNLPRGGELRKSLVAPPGHVIVVCDSAQIEARTLAWFANQQNLLKAFADGEDVYSKFASDIYKFEVNKKEHPTERFVGKTSVLGLGYGMAAPKFQGTLALGLMGPPVEIPLAKAREIVSLYRRTYPHIRALWMKMDGVLETMMYKRVSPKKDDYVVLREGVVEYDEQSLWLPNGLGLHYPELKGEFDEFTHSFRNYSYRAGKEFVNIYGGLLTENLIQALARVIVGEQLLEISDKWRVATMTHDEVVAIAPKEKADECLEDMLRIMSTPPKWASDLPLAAEGGYDVVYSK